MFSGATILNSASNDGILLFFIIILYIIYYDFFSYQGTGTIRFRNTTSSTTGVAITISNANFALKTGIIEINMDLFGLLFFYFIILPIDNTRYSSTNSDYVVFNSVELAGSEVYFQYQYNPAENDQVDFFYFAGG